MTNKLDLKKIVIEALESLQGEGTIIEICKYVWDNYKKELENSGDLFFTWQYDIRWAATKLRKLGIMLRAGDQPKGLWILK